MSSTALGAGNIRKIIFADLAHKRFYFEQLKFVRCQDVYHEALIYCLGICGDTRRNIERIYDFETGCVKTECLKEGWQTSGSMRVVRLAFNLYCNGTPSVYDSEDQNEQLEECSRYGKLICVLEQEFNLRKRVWTAEDLKRATEALFLHSRMWKHFYQRQDGAGIIRNILPKNI